MASFPDKNTILIVDDSPDNLELMSMLLRNAGYGVLTAGDGKEGFEVARRERPNLVVSDVSMPRMDGIEATRQICGLCPHTHVVMLTIYNSAEHIQHALQAGASGYVLKEAAGQELVTAIRALHNGGHYFSPRIDTRHIHRP